MAGVALPTAQVHANPIERVMSVPTGWLYYYGITPAQLSNVLSSGNYRIVDLQVESASSSGPVFTVAIVANTGAYAKGWWWYYGQSIAQVSSALSANRRPADQHCALCGQRHDVFRQRDGAQYRR